MKKKDRPAAGVKEDMAKTVDSLRKDQTAVVGGAVQALYVQVLRRLCAELLRCKE